VPRTQIKLKESTRHRRSEQEKEESQAMEPVRKDIKRIERYSAKKRTTKPGPEYSTL